MANSFFKIKQGLNLANYPTIGDLASIPNPQVGDLVTVGSGAVFTYNGSNWVDVGSSGSVVSVNGQTGVVELDTSEIPESGSLYFTDARAQSAAVVNSMAGSETDQAPSVSSVKGAIQFLPENARYVAKNGSDVTGNGSALAPFQTIQAALDSLPAAVPSSDIPDCVIYVYPGVYNQALNWTRSNTHIVGMQSPRKNIQAVVIKGAIDFNVAIAEPGGIFQNVSSISNCLLTNESGSRNTVNFLGIERVILHLVNCQVYQAVSGYSAIVMNNTNASLSRLYLENCVVQSAASGLGHAIDLAKGALWSCFNTEIYRTGSADASSRAIKMSSNSLVTGVENSTIGSQGTYAIEMAGTGGCTIGTTVIETYAANRSGVLVAAGTAFTAINCVFSINAGTGYAVDGPAGSFFAYSANTYVTNSAVNPAVTKSQLSTDTTTSVIAEGSNQYFTTARARTAAVIDSTAGSETDQAASVNAMKAYISSLPADGVTSVNGDSGPAVSLDTDDVPQGATNLYFTDAAAKAAAVVNSTAGSETDQAPSVSAIKSYISALPAGGVQSVNGETGAVSLDTDDVPQGATNLYFTDAAAKAAAVVNSTAGSETDQAPSVSAIKSYISALPAGGVQSVNGETGAVSLDTDDVPQGATNLYFTDAAAKAAAVVNSTAGSETDQAASVAAMKAYVAAQGGAVSSVNGETGAVVLSASDVGALPSTGGVVNGGLELTSNTNGGTFSIDASIISQINTANGWTPVPGSNSILTEIILVTTDGQVPTTVGLPNQGNLDFTKSYARFYDGLTYFNYPAGYVSGFSDAAFGTQMILSGNRLQASSTPGFSYSVAFISGASISFTLTETQFNFYNFSSILNPSISFSPNYTFADQVSPTDASGEIRLRELSSNGSNYIGLKAADAIAANLTLTLPAADGLNGQALTTDGSGVLSWSSIPSASSTTTAAGYALSSTALNTQTGAYTIQSSDNGRIVIMNSSSPVNVTVPSGLDVGFNCMIVQIGAGQVTMVASGTTLNSASGLKISAQHGALSIISYSSNVFNVSGNTTA